MAPTTGKSSPLVGLLHLDAVWRLFKLHWVCESLEDLVRKQTEFNSEGPL